MKTKGAVCGTQRQTPNTMPSTLLINFSSPPKASDVRARRADFFHNMAITCPSTNIYMIFCGICQEINLPTVTATNVAIIGAPSFTKLNLPNVLVPPPVTMLLSIVFCMICRVFRWGFLNDRVTTMMTEPSNTRSMLLKSGTKSKPGVSQMFAN